MIDSDRKRIQDRGASSHIEGNFGVCSDICINIILSMCDAPNPGGLLTTRQPVEYS